jgi:hypothetical protein
MREDRLVRYAPHMSQAERVTSQPRGVWGGVVRVESNERYT